MVVINRLDVQPGDPGRRKSLSAEDRLPDIDHGAADRDHDVPRQPPSAVSDTWYANNLSGGWLSVTVERWPPLSSATVVARPTRRTSPRSGSGCGSSASPKTGSTSTKDSPAPTGRGPASTRRSPPSVKATPSSCPSSTGSPGRFPTHATSATGSRPAASSCPLAARSTTRPTRWERCSSTSWPRSRNSKSTCCACAPAKEWPSPVQRGGSRAGDRSCRPSSRPSCAACTAPATTPSPTSPNCSTSPDPPSTAPSQPWKLLLHNAAADNASSYFALTDRTLNEKGPDPLRY